MAAVTRTWKSGTTAVAQINTCTIANVEIDDVFGITLTDDFGHSNAITFTATAATEANVSAGLHAAAVAAKTAGYAPWTAVTTTDDSTYITITSSTAGLAFAAACTATNVGGGTDNQTLTDATTTANVSPNDWNQASNWLDGTVPVSTDSQIFGAVAASTSKDINGEDSSAILLVNTWVESGCYLKFGTRDVPLYLDTDYFGFDGSGTGYFKIVNCAEIRIDNAIAAVSPNTYGLHIYGTSGSANTLTVLDPGSSADVGICALSDMDGEFTTIDVYSGNITIGDTPTCTTLNVNGGTVNCSASIDNVNINGGTYRQIKGTPSTALIINAGRVYYNETTMPPITTIEGSGVLDMSEDGTAKSLAGLIVNINSSSASIYDPYDVLDFAATCDFNKVGGTLQVS